MKVSDRRYRHLTLLHSNDLHGDFLAEELDHKLVGGVSMLSGYLNKTRRECPNTLYMIAGDMFQGSLIDKEFQGISTINIMNALGPDIVSLGNHEMDYGIAHLLFLERCCKFPIVNANIYIKTNGIRLFHSHQILHVDGMNILVIGIVTEEIMGRAKKDALLGTFVDVKDAAEEVEVIIDSYRGTDIDLTILLTHIGYENDILLAESLNPALGVDVIIGGHSHTLLEEPTSVNDILIVQAGIGTDQIGRFELEIDTDTNSVASYTWSTVPIDEAHCEKNPAMEELILNYKEITDEKYGAILTTLPAAATHPGRYRETAAGNLFCDILQDSFHPDLVLLGSGSLRKPSIGPIVTLGDLMSMYSFDEKLLQLKMTGAELKSGISFMMQHAPEDDNGHGEYYQISSGFRFVYSRAEGRLVTATDQEKPIEDTHVYTVAMEAYHAHNLASFMGLDPAPIEERGKWKIITGNIRTVLEEYLNTHIHLHADLEGRTKFI